MNSGPVDRQVIAQRLPKGIVDANAVWDALFDRDPFERRNDVCICVSRSDINGWRHLREGIDNRQGPDFAAVEQLAGQEVHGLSGGRRMLAFAASPNIVRSRRRTPILAELSRRFPFWALDLRRHQSVVVLSPTVVGLLRNASLPAILVNTQTGVDLLQNQCNLLLYKSGSLHRLLPYIQPWTV